MSERPSEKESPVILLNPAHGNEPFIMTAAVAWEIRKMFQGADLATPILVMPDLYGSRQRRILLEENPEYAKALHLDDKAGGIAKRMLFAGDFPSHVRDVNTRYGEVNRDLNAHYAKDAAPIEVTRLDGTTVQIKPSNIIGVIDFGSRCTLDSSIPRYYMFPEEVSVILRATIAAPELDFSGSDLSDFARRMEGIEAGYTQIFIPHIGTMGFRYASNLDAQPTTVGGRPRIYTPPMKVPLKLTDGAVEEGIYAMISGTGGAVDVTKELVSSTVSSASVYAPQWAGVEGSVKANPSVMADSNVRAVVTRSGWGTGWLAQQTQTPMLVPAYQSGDDPEIHFNNRTFASTGLGKVIGPEGLSLEDVMQFSRTCVPRIRELNEEIRRKFGTNDGIAFIAKRIFSDLVSS